MGKLLAFLTLLFIQGCMNAILPDRVQDGTVKRTDVVSDCHPQLHATRENCEERGCAWEVTTEGPPCTFPDGYGYTQVGPVVGTPHGMTFNLSRIAANPGGFYGNDIEKLVVHFEYQTNERLRVLITDDVQPRIPEAAITIENPQSSDEYRLYEIEWVNAPQFGFRVIRRSTGAAIFDTTTPGFQFADRYIQFTTRLNSDKLYGFGEHVHPTFKHDMSWREWAMYTRDDAPTGTYNLYGQQPFYMNVESTLHAHGVAWMNANAMEVLLQPNPFPGISWRSLGGVLDLYFFLGPTPEEVIQQSTEAIGRPNMPPYWALGYHLCKKEYTDVSVMTEILDRNVAAEIPMDVQCLDLSYTYEHMDFTADKARFGDISAFVDNLHAIDKKLTILQHPSVSSDPDKHSLLPGDYKPYEEGIGSDIFIRDGRDDSFLEAQKWDGDVHYVDYGNDGALDWWKTQNHDLFYESSLRVEYDGLFFDGNEPSVLGTSGSNTGCEVNDLTHPPYVPKSFNLSEGSPHMYHKSLCTDGYGAWGKQYYTHSLYGHSMALTAWNGLRDMWPDKRAFITTRSQFIGTQKYAGHWFADNASAWPDLAQSIISMLEYSLFGFAFTGAKICGYYGNANEELCQRWHQLGAFYPYSLNSNARNQWDQDPATPRFSEAFRNNVKEIISEKYRLLPLLYTLMHEAHTRGSTVVRPLLNEFTFDVNTHEIDQQFMWGSALLISPALQTGQTEVTAYIPSGRWYDYFTGVELPRSAAFLTLDTPLDKINVHVRGGSIFPLQEPASSSSQSRDNPLSLLVALGAQPELRAEGKFFWDDGETFETCEKGLCTQLDFAASLNIADGQLSIASTVANNGFPGFLPFDTIIVVGLDQPPSQILLDGLSHIHYNFDFATKKLTINEFSRSINGDFVFLLTV